jgi:hypothetical protein
VRGDESSVLTPYFQIAVQNGLGERNATSPYHESLRSFYALPTKDWSIIFKTAALGIPDSHSRKCLFVLPFYSQWFAHLEFYDSMRKSNESLAPRDREALHALLVCPCCRARLVREPGCTDCRMEFPQLSREWINLYPAPFAEDRTGDWAT